MSNLALRVSRRAKVKVLSIVDKDFYDIKIKKELHGGIEYKHKDSDFAERNKE